MWKQPNNSAPPVASDKPLQQTVDSRVKTTTTTTNINTTTTTPTTPANPTITMVATTLTSTPSTSITTTKHTPITTSMPTVVIPAVPMCTPVVQVVTTNSMTTNPTTPITTKRQHQPTIVTPPPQASVQQAPLALTTQTSRSPQPAHQQPPLQTAPIVSQPVPMISFPATNNRPPSSLTIISKTPPASSNIKQETTKVSCSLLDNGIKCDRVATNASFSARIQKIVATKKLNFAIDPSVKHSYICEYHKGILTVAKKSAATPKDNNKSNARNYNTAHNNAANTLNNQQPQPMVYQSTDLSMMPGVITQHPVSIVPLNNQGRIAMNNHAVQPMNNIAVRPGTQVAYGHYQGPHATTTQQPQSIPMDMMPSSFDPTGGDPTMVGPARNNSGVDVDLQQLQVNTLRRYKKHFRVQTRPGLNKMQLAEVLKCHFRTLPIIEKEAITYFVYIAKCYLNKLDHVA